MKKVLTVLLAMLMTASMVACGGEDAASTTDAASTSGATTTTAANKTTTAAPDDDETPGDDTGDDETPGDDTDEEEEGFTLLADYAEWHYELFNCPYTSGDPGPGDGFFDPTTDEMAQYIEAHPDWMTDYETMSTWETYAAPLGDRHLGQGEGNSPIGWSGDAHGLMAYTTFELTADQVAALAKAEASDVYMNIFYDNAIYLYINGTLVYSHDNNCGTEKDWNELQEPLDFNAEGLDYSTLFVEGTNHVSVSLKDCWGGREFILGLEYLPL